MYGATPRYRLAGLSGALCGKYGTDDPAAYSIADRCRLAAALRAEAAADGVPTLGAVTEIAALETAIFVPIFVNLSQPPRPYLVRFDPRSNLLCFACGSEINPGSLTQERTQWFSCPRCLAAVPPPPRAMLAPNQCHICGRRFDDHYKLKAHLFNAHTPSERARHDN